MADDSTHDDPGGALMARYQEDPAQAEAATAQVQARMATADLNLSEAVARLEAAESETVRTRVQSEEIGQRVNELDAEVERQRQEYAEAEEELGRTQDFWYED